MFERFDDVGDLFVPVIERPAGPAARARGARVAERERARSSAPPTRSRRTSDEVIAASKDPNLAEYLRKRTFGPEGTPEPPPPRTAPTTATRVASS